MKIVAIALLLYSLAPDANAVGRLADVRILDRETGTQLTPYRHGSDYWIAGRPGGRYAIVVRNLQRGRLLAVMTVDGVNVVTGETGAWNQRGYVFWPGESYDIDGWRKSDQEIAAFEFTASPDSYAARTGRPVNVGVIGLALFRERPVPAVNSPSRAVEPAAADAARSELGAPALSKLGTGHGARETSYAQSTRFDRLADTPDEIVRIRYDSFENLVAMGIVHRSGHLPPEPFPDSAAVQYVPDPPGGG